MQPARIVLNRMEEGSGGPCLEPPGPSAAESADGVLSSADFELHELLGEGSFAKVYRGVDLRSGAVVAVKLMDLHEDQEMFKKEVKMMGKNQSDYIVQYYGHWMDGHEIGIVMEYCGAGPVNELMCVQGRKVELPEEVIKVVCKHVLSGLSWLHSNRKIHRDVKGCNVLLTEEGQAKLADFGIAARISTVAGHQKTVIGTPFWMAPEVIGQDVDQHDEEDNCGYDFKADIWSLGITAIEMAETRPPYADKHFMKAMHLIHQNDPPTLKHPRKWSAEFHQFLERCLAKDPPLRAGAQELLEHPFITSANEHALLEFIGKEWDNIVARRKMADESYRLELDQVAEEPQNDDSGDESRGASRQSSAESHSVEYEDPGTAIFAQDGCGTTVFHGRPSLTCEPDGTCVFHHESLEPNGTAIFMRDEGRNGDNDSPGGELDRNARIMTEDIVANLNRLDEVDTFDSGTVVFNAAKDRREESGKEEGKPKKLVKKPREGGKKRRESRRVSNVSEPGTRSARCSDVGLKPDSPEDEKRESSGESHQNESLNAETSGSEEHEPVSKDNDKPRKKKPKPKVEGAENEEGKKVKRKVKRKSLASSQPTDVVLTEKELEAWTMEQLVHEVGQIEAQRELEILKINQRFEDKKKLIEQAIAIRRLQEGIDD